MKWFLSRSNYPEWFLNILSMQWIKYRIYHQLKVVLFLKLGNLNNICILVNNNLIYRSSFINYDKWKILTWDANNKGNSVWGIWELSLYYILAIQIVNLKLQNFKCFFLKSLSFLFLKLIYIWCCFSPSAWEFDLQLTF